MYAYARVVLALLCCIFVVACSSNQEDGVLGTPAAPLDGQASDSTITTAASNGQNEPVPDLVHKERLNWSSFHDALAQLPGYQRELVLQFDPAQDAEQASAWRIESVYTFNTSPDWQSNKITYSGAGEITDFQSITIGQSNGSYYLRTPDGSCLAISDQEFLRMSSGIVDPDYYLSTLTEPKLLSVDEIIDGQVAYQYSLDQNSLPGLLGQNVTINGQLFVSEQSGIPLMLSIEASGLADFMDNGQVQDGTLHVEMHVTDFGTGLETEGALNCQESVSYPIPADGHEVTVLDELIGFQSKLSINELISFYESEMASIGWSLVEEPTVVGGSALITFQNGQEQMVIELEQQVESGEVSVVIAP